MIEMVVGDLHLKVSNLDNVKKFLGWLVSTSRVKEADRVVILGDIFHTHAVVRSEVLSLFVEFLLELTSFTEVVILVGNHDMASARQEKVHALEPFKVYDKVTVVDVPTVIGNDLFMPFMTSSEAWQLAFDQLKKEVSRVYCHQPFIGADMGFVKSIDGVLVPSHDLPIISGHIHIAQQLGPVWFPGTPYAQEASDANLDKGVFVVSCGKREFIESPLPRWRNHVANTSNYEAMILAMRKDDHNHLVISGPAPELAAVLCSEKFKKLKREYKFSVRKESTSADKVVERRVSSKSVKEAVVSYVDSVYDGGVAKDKLKAACLEVLGDA